MGACTTDGHILCAMGYLEMKCGVKSMPMIKVRPKFHFHICLFLDVRLQKSHLNMMNFSFISK